MSLMINQSAARNMRSEIMSSMESNIDFYLRSFESEMNRIETLKREYLFDDDFQKISSMSHLMPVHDRTTAFLRIEKKLELLKNSNLYVKEASVNVPLIGKVIYSNRYDEHAMPPETVRALSHNKESPFIYWDERLFISGAYPESNYGDRLPVFLIAVELSKEQIKDSLSRITGVAGGGAILLGHENAWMLNGESQPELLKAISAESPSFAFDNHGRGQGRVKVGGTSYLLTYEKSSELDMSLLLYYPESQLLQPLTQYTVWMWLLSLFSITVIIGFSYWIFRNIHRPLRHLVRALRRVETGDLGVQVRHPNKDEFNYVYQQFNAMVDRLGILIHEVYEGQIRNQRAELKQLQSQINPHFLYNSFYALYRLAKAEDLDKVVKITQHLSKYYHFLTRTGMDEVPLEVEMMHAKSYVEIQMVRFGDLVKVSWSEIPSMCRDILVPRMTLQPLIENAFQYGLEELRSDARLKIDFARHADRLSITIEDNGDRLSDQKLQELNGLMMAKQVTETTGVINVHSRLRLKFGSTAGLRVSRSGMGGMKVELIIPLQREG
jgi:two-component system sensor histidine kinase YesM